MSITHSARKSTAQLIPVSYPTSAGLPMTNNAERKKKRMLGAIVAVIILSAIILGIHFVGQAHRNNPCQGISGCQVIKTIGSGAFGDVYHVRISGADPQDAALKVFKNDQPGQPNTFMCDIETLIMLEIAKHEKERGDKLQISHLREDIPGVESPRMLLEYIDGSDLMALEEFQRKPISELVDFSLSMMKQISEKVLDPMHLWGIYHGDIKLQNMMYTPNKQSFHLIDFGMAVSLSKLKGKKGPRVPNFWGGTLLYVSPDHLEIMAKIKRKEPSELQDIPEVEQKAERADRYSLALTAIVFIGINCVEPTNALCELGKEVTAKAGEIPRNAHQDFVFMEVDETKALLEPIWDALRKKIDIFRQNPDFYEGQDNSFMEILSKDWALFPKSQCM